MLKIPPAKSPFNLMMLVIVLIAVSAKEIALVTSATIPLMISLTTQNAALIKSSIIPSTTSNKKFKSLSRIVENRHLIISRRVSSTFEVAQIVSGSFSGFNASAVISGVITYFCAYLLISYKINCLMSPSIPLATAPNLLT